MPLGCRARLVAHDLRNYADRQLAPLGQAAKTPPQAVQADMVVKPRLGQGLIVPLGHRLDPAGCRRGAGEHPPVPARQALQQGGDIGCQGYGALALHLVVNDDLAPLEVNVLPAQAGEFFAPRPGQQEPLQIGRNHWVADLANSLEPAGQLFTLQAIPPGLLLGQCLLGPGGNGAGHCNLPIPVMLATPPEERPQQAQGQSARRWPVGSLGLDPRLHPLGGQVGKMEHHQRGERSRLAQSATDAPLPGAVLAQDAVVPQVPF